MKFLESELQLIPDYAAASIAKTPDGENCPAAEVNTLTGTSVRLVKRTDATSPVLRMVEDVVELGAQFEELRFPDHDSLQKVNVPVILTRSTESIAAEITRLPLPANSSMYCAFAGLMHIPSVGISVKDCTNCDAARIHCSEISSISDQVT